MESIVGQVLQKFYCSKHDILATLVEAVFKLFVNSYWKANREMHDLVH